MDDEKIHIRAKGWNYVIEEQIQMRWPSPLLGWFPSGSDDFVDWIWKFFQFIFPLDDPRQFRLPDVSTLNDGDRATLSRYLSHAEDLSTATVMTAKSGYEISQKTPDSNIVVSEMSSPRDGTVGFLTMFRQCYSPQEAASFKRAYDLLAKASQGDTRCLEILKAWRRAHIALRITHVDHLILVRAAEVGLVSAGLAQENRHHPVYGHLMPGTESEAAERLDRFLGARTATGRKARGPRH